MRMTKDQYQRAIAKRQPRHKFGAKRVEYDGIKFPSKLEGRYYLRLKQRVAAGEVIFFMRQVPFYLPGGTRYVVDFQEFHSDGTVHFIDTKGQETEAFRIKKREVEHHYPVKIELVKRVD